jgi:hypothetical protein
VQLRRDGAAGACGACSRACGTAQQQLRQEAVLSDAVLRRRRSVEDTSRRAPGRSASLRVPRVVAAAAVLLAAAGRHGGGGGACVRGGTRIYCTACSWRRCRLALEPGESVWRLARSSQLGCSALGTCAQAWCCAAGGLRLQRRLWLRERVRALARKDGCRQTRAPGARMNRAYNRAAAGWWIVRPRCWRRRASVVSGGCQHSRGALSGRASCRPRHRRASCAPGR